MYGSSTAYFWSVSITQIVKEVKFMYFNFALRDIWFTLEDGSTAKTCNCSSSICINDLTIPLSGNLIGMATKAFEGGSSSALDVTVPDLSVWVDSAPQCSDC
jgi:hypothetical protein